MLRASYEPGLDLVSAIQSRRYVVLGRIGGGTLGTVYRAYDRTLRREVAIKRLHPDALESSAQTTVIEEARAMAGLAHPSVVAVYDVEIGEDGAPRGLVMELVRGVSLAAWLKASPRSWRAIVDRFIEAGTGLAAAHATGLLHRNFKPSNVLVERVGRAKVGDFGWAVRNEEHPTGPSAEHQDADRPPVEAPAFEAPETQHDGRFDERSDQYAFCGSLWFALFGSVPDRRPSQESGLRVPRPLLRALQRGLDPDPARRFGTMNDLLRVLTAIRARSQRRIWAGIVAVAAGTGATALVRSEVPDPTCEGAHEALQSVWNDPARTELRNAFGATELAYASSTLERAEREIDRFAQRWALTHREACEATTHRREASEALLDLRMSCLQRAKHDFEIALGVLRGADAETVLHSESLLASLPDVSHCLDAERARVVFPLPQDPALATKVEAARSRLSLAEALAQTGKLDRATAILEEARASPLLAHNPGLRVETLRLWGELSMNLGEFARAEASLQQAYALALEHGAWPDVVAAAQGLVSTVGEHQARHRQGIAYAKIAAGLTRRPPLGPAEEADTRLALAGVLIEQGDFVTAEREYREALRLRREVWPDDAPQVVDARNYLVNALYGLGEYAEAEREIRHVLAHSAASFGDEHPNVAIHHANLGSILVARGRYADAVAEHRRALAIQVAVLGPAHEKVATTRNNLAMALHGLGEHLEAEAEYRRGLAIRESVLAPDHPDIGSSHNNLGSVLYDQGRLDEAEPEYRLALAAWERALGPAHPHVASGRANLGALLMQRERFDDAERELLRALEIRTVVLGEHHPSTLDIREDLAFLLDRRGRHHEAIEAYRVVLPRLLAALGPDHTAVGIARMNLGAALANAGRWADAEIELGRALAHLERVLGPSHPDVALASMHLGRGLLRQRRGAEALVHFERAYAIWSALAGFADQAADAELEMGRARAL